MAISGESGESGEDGEVRRVDEEGIAAKISARRRAWEVGFSARRWLAQVKAEDVVSCLCID